MEKNNQCAGIAKTLEKITSREKYINNQLEQPLSGTWYFSKTPICYVFDKPFNPSLTGVVYKVRVVDIIGCILCVQKTSQSLSAFKQLSQQLAQAKEQYRQV